MLLGQGGVCVPCVFITHTSYFYLETTLNEQSILRTAASASLTGMVLRVNISVDVNCMYRVGIVPD